MLYLWIALMVLLLIAEAATVQLTTVWFAFGALAATITAAILNTTELDDTLSIIIQIIVFTVVSVASLLATRPLVKKMMKRKIQPTNADRNIGETALVTETINNIEGKGAVKVKGIVWTARSADNTVIPQDGYVEIVSIDGAKLIVRAVSQN